MNSPCWGCSGRALGCHGRCKEYEAYKRQQDEIREAEHAAKDATGVLAGKARDKETRFVRGTGRRIRIGNKYKWR